jgi:hypothetical protein
MDASKLRLKNVFRDDPRELESSIALQRGEDTKQSTTRGTSVGEEIHPGGKVFSPAEVEAERCDGVGRQGAAACRHTRPIAERPPERAGEREHALNDGGGAVPLMQQQQHKATVETLRTEHKPGGTETRSATKSTRRSLAELNGADPETFRIRATTRRRLRRC